ncbi:hypothetical protein [Mycolicibacterium llatzerense]|uniref:hypothetical protein n=2 Tax=Mycolicibacterium llatzerense TaxID=280871 RepID=UPI0021B6A358|nr:hypothetical protein [Mycolicibacterium llatzerense]
MLLAMAYTEEERRRIAEVVKSARITRNLDKEPAARSAKINSITWKRVEDAESVRDASLGKILSSLGLPSADELLGQQVIYGVPRIEANEEQPQSPTLPVIDGEPTIVHATRLLWQRIVALAESPDGDLQRQDKADRVVIVAADVIADVLLGLNAGTPAKPLIEEMFTRATLAAQRRQARTTTEGGQDGLESTSQSDASPEEDEGEKNPDELADEGESASARLGAAVEVGRPKLQVEDVSEDA